MRPVGVIRVAAPGLGEQAEERAVVEEDEAADVEGEFADRAGSLVSARHRGGLEQRDPPALIGEHLRRDEAADPRAQYDDRFTGLVHDLRFRDERVEGCTEMNRCR